MAHDLVTELLQYSSLACFMPIWQLCANLLIPNCLRSNLSYSPLAALELYVIKIGSLELDIQTRTIYQASKELKRLSKLEFSLLKLLYSHKGEIVSYEKIEELWEDAIMNEHSLYNYIVKLRKILAADPDISISTIGGNGYMLLVPM